MAELGCEERQELTHVAGIGVERLVRMPALVAQIGEPVAHGPVEIGPERELWDV